MPTRKQKTAGKQGADKIKSLKLKKETVRDLTVEDAGKVKGGTGIDTRPECVGVKAK
jgi:hypothetical protein